MKAGFTGTRNGMTDAQKEEFVCLLATLGVTEFHHGDCVGADDEAANICREFQLGKGVIIAHPPINEKSRAWNRFATETRHPKPYHERNHDIVDETEVLIATPFERKRQAFGGTWSTVRYAESKQKRVYVILPDGSLESKP
jgi:hypothetical protein